jgi:hypothetical protein
MSIGSKEEWQDFLRSLGEVRVGSLNAPGEKRSDIGLVIVPIGKVMAAVRVLQQALRKKPVLVDLGIGEEEKLADDLRQASKDDVWAVLRLKGEVSPTTITWLKQIVEDGAFTVAGQLNEPLRRVVLADETRIIVVAEATTLEAISYPRFVNLFGSVLRLEA